MGVLPAIDSRADFGERLANASAWAPALAAIQDRHGLDEPFTQTPFGSVAVFLSPSWCIKLHPPLSADLESCRLETAVLGHLSRDGTSRLPIDIPILIAEGSLDGWEYFVATRLPGRPLDDVWPSAPAALRETWARQLGEGIRALHGLPLETLARFAQPWDEFRRQQRACCLEREQQHGLEPMRMRELEAFLAQGDDEPAPAFEPALLHTEIGPGHVLVHEGRISGLIDFGDAMIGDPEYDLGAVGLFVTRGDAAAFRAFGDGYGAQVAPPRRLLRHALLHKYGTLAWYLKKLAPPAIPLAALADHWFGVG